MASSHIAIACQGGGSHAAYTGGVLPVLLEEFDNRADEDGPDHSSLVAISGTSGGAISAQELGFVDAINRRTENGRGDDPTPAGAAAQRRGALRGTRHR